MKRRKELTAEEITELEHLEILEAEGRRVFNPLDKVFDHSNKRVTDLDENCKVMLPRPCDQFTESSIEMLNRNIMKTFDKYLKR